MSKRDKGKQIDFQTHSNSFLKPRIPESQTEKRLHPRFEVAFEVIVSDHKESFRSYTLNLSQSGLLLAQSIPERMRGKMLEIVLVVYKSGHRLFLHFQALVIGKFLPTGRLHFVHFSKQVESELQCLLNLMNDSKGSLT